MRNAEQDEPIGLLEITILLILLGVALGAVIGALLGIAGGSPAIGAVIGGFIGLIFTTALEVSQNISASLLDRVRNK